MNTSLAERLHESMKAKGMKPADLARACGVKPPSVSDWLSGKTKTMKAETLRKAAASLDVDRDWLETGKVRPSNPADEVASLPKILDGFTVHQKRPHVDWEALMTDLDDLPELFTLDMPDDSMSPATPRGTRLIFDRGASAPPPGHGVLVIDSHGDFYVRRYQQGAGGRWIAQATNTAYAPLDSERDGLRIVAIVTGRMSGQM